MKEYIINNANWLKRYNDNMEVQRLSDLFTRIQIKKEDELTVADIGCGNGRSITLLQKLLPHSFIYAVDYVEDNIEYAKYSTKNSNVCYIVDDAFSFLANEKYNQCFDLIFFSWSLFDMIVPYSDSLKYGKLSILIDYAKKCLKKHGCIIVTQPTKGGTFEKLLSYMIPNSDEDYFITHSFLINNEFIGPKEITPSEDNPLCIWSRFICTEDELYLGVSSVVMLETGANLDKEEFGNIFAIFLKNNGIRFQETYTLSDCVNIYYLQRDA